MVAKWIPPGVEAEQADGEVGIGRKKILDLIQSGIVFTDHHIDEGQFLNRDRTIYALEFSGAQLDSQLPPAYGIILAAKPGVHHAERAVNARVFGLLHSHGLKQILCRFERSPGELRVAHEIVNQARQLRLAVEN